MCPKPPPSEKCRPWMPRAFCQGSLGQGVALGLHIPQSTCIFDLRVCCRLKWARKEETVSIPAFLALEANMCQEYVLGSLASSTATAVASSCAHTPDSVGGVAEAQIAPGIILVFHHLPLKAMLTSSSPKGTSSSSFTANKLPRSPCPLGNGPAVQRSYPRGLQGTGRHSISAFLLPAPNRATASSR